MEKMALKPGEGLQLLVHALERAIHSNPGISVESPKHFPDKDTGRPREHDVVLTFKLAHHTLLTALECRDRSKKVGVPDVEQFAKKCERTGIHRGIIVSSTGFAGSALRKAAALDIGCLSLEEAARFDWCRTPGLECITRDLLPGPAWEIGTALPYVGPPEIYDEHGPIDAKKASNIAHAALNQRPKEMSDKQDREAIVKPVLCVFVNEAASSFHVVDAAGNKRPLTRMVIPVLYRARFGLVPFSFRQYIDVAKGTGLSNVAFAPVEVGGVKGNVVLHEAADGIRFSFVPLPSRAAKKKSTKKKGRSKPK